MIRVETLPPEITTSNRCVVWKREHRDGKATKVPYDPKRPTVRAAVSDSRTWASFSIALAVAVAGKADGLGIMLGDGLVGVDLDHCRDIRMGTIEPAIMHMVHEIDSYTEVSPSGTGLHILCRGMLPAGGRKKGAIEMYSEGRYFTITGEHLAGTPTMINERTAALARLHAQVFGRIALRPLDACRRIQTPQPLEDAAVLARARAARNGARFTALWAGAWESLEVPSQSEADLGLCNMLAYWTNGNAEQIDRLFRRSGLMRAKWDELRGNSTYGALTIARAIGSHLERCRA